jgi:hypothetical protein
MCFKKIFQMMIKHRLHQIEQNEKLNYIFQENISIENIIKNCSEETFNEILPWNFIQE